MAEEISSGETTTDSEIDDLLKQAASFTDAAGMPAGDAPADSPPAAQAAAAPEPPSASTGFGDQPGGFPDQASLDELLRQATFDDPSASPATPGGAGAAGGAAPAADPFNLPNFSRVLQEAQASNIDLLRDVELNVKIELGRARMLVEDVLRLSDGSVVELDKLAGDPVDVFVNDRLVARGEVLVLNDNFCVRVNEIITGAKDEGL